MSATEILTASFWGLLGVAAVLACGAFLVGWLMRRAVETARALEDQISHPLVLDERFKRGRGPTVNRGKRKAPPAC